MPPIRGVYPPLALIYKGLVPSPFAQQQFRVCLAGAQPPSQNSLFVWHLLGKMGMRACHLLITKPSTG